MKVRARVYARDGNRFLIPGHWYSDDDPGLGQGSASAVNFESLMYEAACGLEAGGWLELTADEAGRGAIAHYPVVLAGPQFTHGGLDVMLISGPLFDEAAAAETLT